jgi:hypothetical protein
MSSSFLDDQMDALSENIISFRLFYQLYQENKDKLHMKESDGMGQHPINKEAVKRWIERIGRLENEDERKFYLFYAKAFAAILETSYVTYPTFLNAVNTMAEEIFNLMINNKYDRIEFIVSGEVEKSNLWISLLCMDYWDKKINFFSLTKNIVIRSFGDRDRILLDTSKKTLFLHFDDMSYSGGQVAQGIRKFLGGIFLPNTPKFDYYLAIPYVTDIAQKYITQNNRGVKVLSSTKIIPNFVEQVKAYYITLSASEQEENRVYLNRLQDMCHKYWFVKVSNLNRNRVPSNTIPMRELRRVPDIEIRYMGASTPPPEFYKGVWAFRCSTFKTLIYFDHKLADDASTFQKVLYFGSYPINGDHSPPQCEHENLIEGCEVNSKVLNYMKRIGKNACRNYIQYGSKTWNINQNVICPKTFYKNIRYTLGFRIERNPVRGGEPLITKPYHLDSTANLNRNIDYFLFHILGLNVQLLYPETNAMHSDYTLYEKHKEMVNQKWGELALESTSALDGKLKEIQDFEAMWKPRSQLNNLGSADINIKPKNASFLNRVLGSVLPFYGGKSRKLKKRVKKTRKSKK